MILMRCENVIGRGLYWSPPEGNHLLHWLGTCPYSSVHTNVRHCDSWCLSIDCCLRLTKNSRKHPPDVTTRISLTSSSPTWLPSCHFRRKYAGPTGQSPIIIDYLKVIVTFATKVIFLPLCVCLFVCLSLYLTVSRITQTAEYEFLRNFLEGGMYD